MYQRIPTPEEVNQAYMNYTQAAEELGVEIDTNIAHTLRKLGLQTVRLAGKPMVYRHQVEALAAKHTGQVQQYCPGCGNPYHSDGWSLCSECVAARRLEEEANDSEC